MRCCKYRVVLVVRSVNALKTKGKKQMPVLCASETCYTAEKHANLSVLSVALFPLWRLVLIHVDLCFWMSFSFKLASQGLLLDNVPLSSGLPKFELFLYACVPRILGKPPAFGRGALSTASPCFGYAVNLTFPPDLCIIFNAFLWPCSSEQDIVPDKFCKVVKARD